MTSNNEVLEKDYKGRIDRVFDFIDENLDGDLSLDSLSKVAFFSPYHFHRVFKFVTGETLNQYVTRRRIEKSALDLLHTTNSISEITQKYGFNDVSSFDRAFRKFYNLSPSQFRKQNPNKFSKIRQLESKNGQTYPNHEKYICIINDLKKWTVMNAKIEVTEISQMEVAALTHIGTKDVEQGFNKLIRWALPQNLMSEPESKLGRLFYDSAKVTPLDKVRMSIFLRTNLPYETTGEIKKSSIPGSRCIVGRYEICPNEFEKAWTGLFVWMNEHGYKKNGANPFEIYHNDFREHPEHKFVVDLFIPIF